MTQTVEYFQHLVRLLEMERRAERERLQELKKSLPPAELEEKGLLFSDLEATDERVGLGGKFLVTLERFDKKPFPHLLSNGDCVGLFPKKAEIEEPASAVVNVCRRKYMEVAFDRPPPEFVSDGRLRLELLANDVTFERARKAVQAVAGMEKGQARDTRDVLLGQKAPRFNVPRAFEASSKLNPEQLDAVAKALSAQDFFLVHGPPGTGKSTVLAEIAVQVVRQGKRLLCTAASNAAVDHLLELCLNKGLNAVRLGHPARVLPHLQAHTLDLLVEEHPDRKLSRKLFDEAFDLQGYARKQRTQGRSRERFANARESAAEARSLIDDARKLERKAVKSILEAADVLCATTSTLESGHLADMHFDVALLDEATQVIEPLALGVFSKADCVILAGDHQQLPPTVLSEEAAKAGLSKSLFERLLEMNDADCRRMLKEQYRMNEAIMRFPSDAMYEGQLRAHPSVAHHTLFNELPFLFLDTAGKGFSEEFIEGTQSLRNPQEGELVLQHARKLLAEGLPPVQLGIISPYRAQAEWLREALGVAEVEVDTVDAFQGREKDAVLVSLARSNSDMSIGFLSDVRRMNVALTRARRHLMVVGDSATLSSHDFYLRLLNHAQASDGYLTAWEWPPLTGSS